MTVDVGKWRDWAVAPGEILAESLEERGMSQSELARRMNRPVKTINEIVNGKAAITTDTAIQLELALGITADFWNNLETSYRAHLSRERSTAELESQAEWAERFPIADLVKARLIQRPSNRAEKAARVLTYFGVSSPEAWEGQWRPQCASLRASPAHETSFPAVAAWLRWGELVAAREKTPPFDSSLFRTQLRKVRSLTRQDPTAALAQTQEICRIAGVVVVLIPEFKATRLSGAARHLTNRRALIQLSARHKTEDQLWFTFFHEAAHILEERSDRIDPADLDERVDDDAEREADRFAREFLIDTNAFVAFQEAGAFKNASGSEKTEAVRRFAKEAGVSPGIVIGRLQREELLSWSSLNELKKRVRFEPA